jgi:hypothetical protein
MFGGGYIMDSMHLMRSRLSLKQYWRRSKKRWEMTF